MSLSLTKTALVALTLASLPGLAAADALTLKRVSLSTGGLGYFEYETQVTGNATLALSVPLAQVDDVLKSLVVYDATGQVGTVSLPGRQPLSEVFRSLPFDQAALTSPAELLRSLAGAELSVAGPQASEGRILSVVEETEFDGEGRVSTQTRVTLMGARGLSSFILERAQEIAFADPELQAKVNEALLAMARHGERDRRTLTLSAPGEGLRKLRVAYVVEVPLWKTSYRLTVAEGSGDSQAALQGWAVLENQSGEDWSDVDLSLVSGNPVAFRQALYQSYYLDRPEIPVQVVDRILPPVDRARMAAKGGNLGRMDAPEADRSMGQMLAAEAAPAPLATPAAAGILEAATRESVSQAIYRFPTPVSVADGHSLLVPFLDRTLPVERLSVYRPDTAGRHPLASLRLANDSGVTLPPGLITLYERDADARVGYLGDARLGLLPQEEGRLVSFAVDAKVDIDSRQEQRQQVTQVTLTDGVMTLRQTDRLERIYRIRGASDGARVLLLEEPYRLGWSLTAPAEGVEEAADGYRVTLTLQPGERRDLVFALERPLDQQVLLADLDDQALGYYLNAAFVPDALKPDLAFVASLKGDLAEARRALARVEAERAAIVADQERLRENLAAVPADSDLGRRYLAQLSGQEDRLEALNQETKSRQATEREAAEALRSFIAELSFQ
ncbi:MAG: hypothetical protein Kilf2KO_01140 [Rhodospirillales bacterium]